MMFNNPLFFGQYKQTFCDLFPSLDDFKAEYDACELPLTAYFGASSSDQVKLLYYLLYAKYGNSTICGSDVNKWKYRLFAKVFQFGPSWKKRIDIQKSVRELTLEALQGALQGFVLTNTNLGHCNPSFRSSRLDISRIDRRMAKKPYSHYSKNISARQSLNLRFFRYFLSDKTHRG